MRLSTTKASVMQTGLTAFIYANGVSDQKNLVMNLKTVPNGNG